MYRISLVIVVYFGHCLYISGYVCIFLKFMRFLVAKMYGNNDRFYGGTKYRNNSHKMLL